MRGIRSALCTTLAATAALVASPPLSGQPYPAKPVKIVIPFPPGAVVDTTGRFVAQRLTTVLGQPVIVENKSGASGIIGTEAGLRAPPDGYTLTLISSAYTTVAAVHRLGFDPIGDVAPIVQISQEPFLVAVTPTLPVKTIQELIALAKANPGELSFASGGPGSPSHLAAELFAIRTGIRMNHVPYKGGAPALTDTVAGHTDLVFTLPSNALPHVKAGRLRAIAVASRQRSAAAPAVPTVAESGIPDYELALWVGLVGPKGLPSPIVTRINREVGKLLASPETIEKLQKDGELPIGGTPEQFLATIKEEIELWREVAREAGLLRQ